MAKNSKVTIRQQQILDYIIEKIKTDGYPPSVREIGQAVGLRSSSTVHSHLVQLEEKGLIRKDPSIPRAIIPVNQESDVTAVEPLSIPIIGNVAAGSPILAEQNIEGYLPVPADFISQGTHFVLRVKGESMIEAGILNDDYLIVRQQEDAANGEIIVAIVGDEATVKRYYRHDEYVELRPENSAMKPLVVRDVHIAGKVCALLRKL
ncbi:MAG: transcriptional repressor LexA [Syntrophomonadaceae bacterium]|nr:transcriptional repressor LexA [Syntrophomonadaceae bacterium]MDD4549264.1 transcriptional repressor LexA [Syntrophomonadaceae bacterium]